MNQTYTSGEAAKICGLSLSTIKRWIKRGALRIYRTPGGDIRIPHEQLHDFMREYEIPLHRLEAEPLKILLAFAQGFSHKVLLKQIYKDYPEANIHIADNAMDLGFALGSFRPGVIVIAEPKIRQELSLYCEKIRSFLAPAAVRIGAFDLEKSEIIAKNGPDVILEQIDNTIEIKIFLKNLIDSKFKFFTSQQSDKRRSA